MKRSVWKVAGYPKDYWFFGDWEIFDWCRRNNIDVMHMCSGGPHGNALRINPRDVDGETLFKLTWL